MAGDSVTSDPGMLTADQLPDDAQDVTTPSSKPSNVLTADQLPKDAVDSVLPSSALPSDATDLSPQETDYENRLQAAWEKHQATQALPTLQKAIQIGGNFLSAALGAGKDLVTNTFPEVLKTDLSFSPGVMAARVISPQINKVFSPNLTPEQDALRLGNTAMAGVSTIPNLVENFATGANNMVKGSALTREEFQKQFDAQEEQNKLREGILAGGIQTALTPPPENQEEGRALVPRLEALGEKTYNPIPTGQTLTADQLPKDAVDVSNEKIGNFPIVPQSARASQEALAPILDPSNIALMGMGGAAAKVTEAIAKRMLGDAAARGVATGLGEAVENAAKPTIAGRAVGAAATGMEGLAKGAEWLKEAPANLAEHLGMSDETVNLLRGPAAKVIMGMVAGGTEGGATGAVIEAAPKILQSTADVLRTASSVASEGPGVMNFYQKMAQRLPQGFPKVVFKTIAETPIAKVLDAAGNAAGAVGKGALGGVINPLTAMQIIADDGDPDKITQTLAGNAVFGAAGGALHTILSGQGARIAAQNANDVISYAKRLNQTRPDQFKAFSDLDYQSQVLLSQLAQTRPDLQINLNRGLGNKSYVDPNGRPNIDLDMTNKGAAFAHIAAHEFGHTLMSMPEARTEMMRDMLGNPDIGTKGLLGEYDNGVFKPTPKFQQFTDQYKAALTPEQRAQYQGNDRAFWEKMGEEYYVENNASRLAGMNESGQTGYSKLFQRDGMFTKAMDRISQKFGGPSIYDYIDHKYTQGTVPERWGAKGVLSKAQTNGLDAMGIRKITDNIYPKKPIEWESEGRPGTSYTMQDLKGNPEAAKNILENSFHVQFSSDSNGNTIIRQRTDREAKKLARQQAKIWFDHLSTQDTANLPEGAVRMVTRADGKQELSGRFLTDEQIDNLVRLNGLSDSQAKTIRELSHDAQTQNGKIYDGTYFTATDAKDRSKYATLGTSTRPMIFNGFLVAKKGTVLARMIDMDQLERNYHAHADALLKAGKELPIQGADIHQAMSDYLKNHELGYEGDGTPDDKTHPPSVPPARVFSSTQKNFINELFGVADKETRAKSLRHMEIEEEGGKPSLSVLKSFRIDRLSKLDEPSDERFVGKRLPFDYRKVNVNYSPNISEKDEQGMYSRLENVVNSQKQDKFSPEQIKAIVNNPQNVKPDEVKWTGINQAIDRIAQENGGKVTKQDLLNHIQGEGKVPLKENLLQDRKILTEQEKKERFERLEEIYNAHDDSLISRQERNRKIQELEDELYPSSESYKGGTQYKQYQLPGGNNYREVVLGMDVNKNQRSDEIAKEQYGKTYDELNSNEKTDVNSIIRSRAREGDNGKTVYTSSHFPEIPNYLAHMRLNDREDSQGRPGTFIEELQSDRHQQGRERGYAGNPEELERLKKTESDLLQKHQEILKSRTATRAQRENSLLEWQKANEALAKSKVGIPDAPYRTSWPTQLFKRALRDAVQNNHDWIGWTSGETQNERYDLSKQVDKIDAWRMDDEKGLYDINVTDKNGKMHKWNDQPASRLPDIIGKEMAEKIVNHADVGDKGVHLSGLDLKVGGEGMKGFYDNILPKEISKYVKQWGGKVEKEYISTPEPKTSHYTPTKEGLNNKTEIWKVEITPQMKADIAERGQERYSPNIEGEGGLTEGVQSENENRYKAASTPNLGVSQGNQGVYGSDPKIERASSYIRGGVPSEQRTPTQGPEKPLPQQQDRGDFEARFAREVPKLITFSDGNGLRFPAARLFDTKEFKGGVEHEVYFNPKTNRVIKITRPGGFGLTAEAYSNPKTNRNPFRVGLGAGTPSTYLDRINLQNKVFGDNIKLEGFVKRPDKTGLYPKGEGIDIVTSQPYRDAMKDSEGEPIPPSPKEIKARMTEAGFKPLPNWQNVDPDYTPMEWWRDDGVIATDTHAGNFIKGSDGVIYPIDVVMSRLSPENLEKFKKAFNKPTNK